MMRQRVLPFILISVILGSCAGLGIQSSAEKEFERGLALFNKGKYEEAIPFFKRAVEFDPDYAQGYFYLGRSFLNLSRWIEALAPLRTAYRLAPEDFRKEIVTVLIDALIGGAISEFQKRNYQNTISYLREALTLEPGSHRARDELVVALIAYGGMLLSEGKVPQAIPAFSEATELSPDNLDAYLGLARAFYQNGDYLEALKAVKNVIRVAPSNSEAQSLFRELLLR